MSKFLLLAALVLLQVSCGIIKPHSAPDSRCVGITGNNPGLAAAPPVLVYKTKKDYRNYVPVLLSADKSKIVSYPAPSDLVAGTAYLKPLQLKGEYLLDQRGIGINVAFLNLTYEEYALLPEAPSKAALMILIQDKDPLEELCNCGKRNAFTEIEAELNQLIREGNLRQKCSILK